MKAVEAALNEVRDEAVASGAAAATPLLSLKTLSEKAMRDMPGAASFQNLFSLFRDLYSQAAARIEALRTGIQSSQDHFEPEAASVPLTPAPDDKCDEPSHAHIESEAGGSPPPSPPPPPPPAPVAVPAAAPVPVGKLAFQAIKDT
ncbi:putative bifunctional UDP-N-acetylglucosamine transferase and deubiquitinase ALG13 [Haemorhous mexicanus]|uniref:putative bifunctional UDP-N-acetylglucosamine transferase and deubiquitinase ALG13 n=1 Tax=Haemorhous mexicanus TaxID=30427 RepID=UPI0028BD8941|nr:putative bifunctional UDP-N-acetylglucosamine transferase and deubiquitinase ALG13 [Haemorhous mexicanus]